MNSSHRFEVATDLVAAQVMDGEVVVINLMGEIRPQSFSNVMVALDVDNDSAKNVQVASVN